MLKRRVFAEQLFLFKIVNGLSDSSELLSQLSFNARVSNLRGRELLYFNKPNTTSHKYSPLLRMSSKFNEFSRVWDLDFSFSLLKYKQNLNKILNDHWMWIYCVKYCSLLCSDYSVDAFSIFVLFSFFILISVPFL